MEKLFKRADGYCEASNGFFAAVPNRRTGIEKENYFFTFKPSFNAQSIRVEWSVESNIVIIPQEIAITMIRLNHARNLTAEEVEQYNASVDFDDQSEQEEEERLAKEQDEKERLAKEQDEKERLAKEQAGDDTPADEKPADVQADENDEDDDAVEGDDKPKRGRKKKDAEEPKKPLSIPGLSS